jgi:hypothetical protein
MSPVIDRLAFARDGFVIVPAVVDDERISAARRAINSWLVNGIDPSELPNYRQRSFAPELTQSDEIIGLCTQTPVLGLAEVLIGQPLRPPDTAQIALRFPTAARTPGPAHAPRGHIDGLPAPNNGVPSDGRVHADTVLAGVFLSDVPAGEHGNFTVWPGTHHEMAAWFRANGTDIASSKPVKQRCTELSSRPGVPLAVRRGDVVFVHHLLVHAGGPNNGPDIRYGAFFRLRLRPPGEYDDRALTDPWHEYRDMPPQRAPHAAIRRLLRRSIARPV